MPVETLEHLRRILAGDRSEPPAVGRSEQEPARCFHPDHLRTWGWAVQLYALRSRNSWGIGDLGDLRVLVGEVAGSDGVVLINPLHAVTPRVPQEASPYYASSRCFRNPLYLDVDEVADMLGTVIPEGLADEARSLNARRRIDRDRVHALKMSALERMWDAFHGHPSFDRYRAEMGQPLENYATFVALAEFHRMPWTQWPKEHNAPGAPGIEGFRRAHRGRIDLHVWLQWLLDRQLEAASEAGDIVHDLAVGVDPEGADAWMWQDHFAQGVTVGAPPDDYNPEGQNWAALAFDPWALVETDFEPLAYTFRCAMRHATGLRIDHVMSLFRLFWIPEGAPASAGAYVRYPATQMLDVLARESRDAGCYVIGEDLGTVEPIVREEMQARSMLSYKLMWFEEGPPAGYPALCMAAANTHDLPTTAGLWTGEDTRMQIDAGLDPSEDFKERIVSRIVTSTGVDRSATASEVIERSYGSLATSPAEIALGSIEDVLEVTERYNQPGTTGEWNWSTALPAPLEDLVADSRYAALKGKLANR